MVGIFDRLDAFDVLALGGRRLRFFSGFLKLKQGVVVQRHLFCDRHYPITKIFLP